MTVSGLGGRVVMDYEVDYAEGEKEGCSSKLTIEHRIFYVKLLMVPLGSAVYYAGDQHGILKEISKAEFEFWLKVLAEKEQVIEAIKKKLGVGKKYAL
jgi:hypothetical protein